MKRIQKKLLTAVSFAKPKRSWLASRCGWLLALFLFATVGAQADEDFLFFEYENLTLEQSLNLKTNVATKSPASPRESPNIITIITREEVQNSGARDIFDVLRLVPGIEFGVDIQGIIGIGFRGIWGQEGKVLVMVDGQMLNDLGYAGTQIDRIPVAQIERVEVIRGPGSVIYGGNAELAVINILTRGAREKGVQATGLAGFSSNGGDRGALDVHYGTGSESPDSLHLSGAAHFSKTPRSDRHYTDSTGNAYSMKDNSDLTAKSANIGIEKGGFHSRIIVDEFLTTQRDAFGVNQASATQINSHLYLAEAAYDLKLGQHWTITPRFNLNRHEPWNEHDDYFMYDKTYTRTGETITTQYEHSQRLTLLGGAEFQQDHAKVSEDTPDTALWPGNQRHINYDNQAYFAQGQVKLPMGTIVGGGRYEYHSAYKDSFVPRLAWTKLWERLNIKALYSQAFRTPSLENIRLNTNIRPEKLTTYEVETGYQFSDSLFASIALFDMTIRKPIIYHYDSLTSTEYYSNDDPTGTHGFELTSRWKGRLGYADLSYSFYSATKRVPLYSVPGHSGSMLGWPTHKIALNSNFNLGRGVSLNPSAILLVKRYGYDPQDASGNMTLRRYPTVFLLNFFIQKKDAFRKGLDIGIGVFDLLSSNYSYIQPYNSGHTPLPGGSREFISRVSYQF